MTDAQFKAYNEAAKNGTLSDDENPIFAFSQISSAMLADILSGKLDAMDLARRELAARGQNEKGIWVGFKK